MPRRDAVADKGTSGAAVLETPWRPTLLLYLPIVAGGFSAAYIVLLAFRLVHEILFDGFLFHDWSKGTAAQVHYRR